MNFYVKVFITLLIVYATYLVGCQIPLIDELSKPPHNFDTDTTVSLYIFCAITLLMFSGIALLFNWVEERSYKDARDFSVLMLAVTFGLLLLLSCLIWFINLLSSGSVFYALLLCGIMIVVFSKSIKFIKSKNLFS